VSFFWVERNSAGYWAFCGSSSDLFQILFLAQISKKKKKNTSAAAKKFF
jgi:hypothetical protein